jgi:hypothetical protein
MSVRVGGGHIVRACALLAAVIGAGALSGACGPSGVREPQVQPAADSGAGGGSGGAGGAASGGSGGGGAGGADGSASGGAGGNGGPDASPDVAADSRPSAGDVAVDSAPADTGGDTAAPDSRSPDAGADADPEVDLPRGLVGRWQFEERSGTMAPDSSGRGNDGTLVGGPTWAAAGFPAAMYPNTGALTFDGDNDQVQLKTAGLPANNGMQSIALWISYAAAPSGTQNFVALTDGKDNGSRLQIGLRNGNVSAWKHDAMDLVSFRLPGTGWHHVAYTYDGRTHRLYVDGVQRDTATTAPDNGAVASARLGTYHQDKEYFRGTMDEVRIYDRVLGQPEVTALFQGRQ